MCMCVSVSELGDLCNWGCGFVMGSEAGVCACVCVCVFVRV